MRRLLLTACLLSSTAGVEAQPTTQAPSFEIHSDFEGTASWVGEHLQDSAGALDSLLPTESPRRLVTVTLEEEPGLDAVISFTGPDRLTLVSGAFGEDKDRLSALTLGLTRLHLRRAAGGAALPSDWCNDVHCPMAEYVTCLVLRDTGHPEEGIWRKVEKKGDPRHDLFWSLDSHHGPGLLARYLRLLRDDELAFDAVGSGWPAPDATRSTLAAAYLSLAAGENLAGELERQGIGEEPPGWTQAFPDVTFTPYSLDQALVEDVMASRHWLFGKMRHDRDLEPLRMAFREGRIGGVLDSMADAAVQQIYRNR